MVKSPKQESRKTVWRGISVKADSRPSSTQSQDSSLSWEKQPPSPLSQEHPISIKSPPDTPKFEDYQHTSVRQQEPDTLDDQRHSSSISVSPSNSTTVSSTKSSSNSSSKLKKEKLAGLGSLTKTYDSSHHNNDNKKSSSSSQKKKGRKEGRATTLGSLTKTYEQSERRQQREQERKERKEKEKLERQARKDQEKLEKEIKEQQKKELKELKEQQKKERKSKTKSTIFSRSSKSSTPTSTGTGMLEIAEGISTHSGGRQNSGSFGHNLVILPPKSGTDSNLDITVAGTTMNEFGEGVTDDSSSEEFVDFTDSHTSIMGSSGLIPQKETSNTSSHLHQATQPSTSIIQSDLAVQSSLQPPPRPRTPKLSEYLQQQPTTGSLNRNTNTSSNSSNSTTRNGTNTSMFYILNSLQDAGRNIEDDDLLDDSAAKKMDATQQQQQRSSFSYHKHDMPGQQFDQHIQALEIMARRTSISSPPTDPLPPLPTGQQTQRQTYHSGDKMVSMDSDHSPSPNWRLSISSKISRGSSASNSSHDTASHMEIHHSSSGHYSQHHHPYSSPLTSPHAITAISEEELTMFAPKPISSAPGPLSITTTVTNTQHKKDDDVLLDSPIDDYITNANNNNNNNTSNNSANQQDDSDNQLDDTDSCSFESTDIPDPFLIPSDDSDRQHTSSRDPRNCDAIMKTANMDPIMLLGDTETSPYATTKKEKDILDEALKVKTSDNVSGRQVSVMQVNISHKSALSTASNPTLLAPMTAVVEYTSTLSARHDDTMLSIGQDSPSTQPSCLPSKIDNKISPVSAVSLEQESPVYVESPATLLSVSATTANIPTNTAIHSSTIIPTNNTNDKVTPNLLKPRQQEEADQPIKQGIKFLFGNKFTKAITIFNSKAESEPLHALGLGSMLLLKAMMTYNGDDVDAAMDALTHAYTIAGTQAELSEATFDDTFSSQFSSLMASTINDNGQSSIKSFQANGVLRAQVIQAECCLLMGILQLTQENMAGYLKCGLNLRKACAGYRLAWEEYQRMGDQVSEWMDENTVSAIQFGVGTLHLLLSSLPAKIVNTFSGLPWKTDKNLGFALLKTVMTGQGTRSSLGSLMLLSYYSILSSSVPSIYAQESIETTIECLVVAQKSNPKSCFFLYYAARISRVARNVGLSTQSFTMATTSTRRGAWAEVAMKHTAAYEVGLNHAMQLDWDTSAAYFEQLCCARDWSPAFCQYFVGACHEMLGQRQEAKDAFDEVPVISHQQHHRKSFLDNYVQVKVEQYQYQDYQDLDSSLPGLELLLLLNAFGSMEDSALCRCLVMIEETCQMIDLDDVNGMGSGVGDNSDDDEDTDNDNNVDTTMMARYGTLLLLRCTVLNALSRHNECIPNLDWILKNKRHMENEDWLLPFVYWEAGVTYWGISDYKKSRQLWQLALSYTSYDFEYRMACRIHLALEKCNELGVPETSQTSLNGRKRI
ncbi:hypothetical protein BC941DRAFT_472167 [Chlamydoabsidia padenii]|nr:hypothetical protein BC941DRAFT_472167 [Chlamydoabsidia padenii]